MKLRLSTSPKWIDAVLADFDAFLLDHASCERKASATALAFTTHYPDRPELVAAMIELAREELEHFQQVYRFVAARGLTLAPDRKDRYVRRLRAEIRQGRDAYLLDRLLVGGIVEARGCERFALLAGPLEGELQDFYRELARAEARHHALFVRLANDAFDAALVSDRLDELLEAEARIVVELPLRAAVH